MHEIDQKIDALGIVLPDAPAPMANYVSVQKAGDIWFFSGAGPMKEGKPTMKGRLGENLTIEEGYQAAREGGINLISALKRALDGDWDKLEQIVKIQGFVSSTNDFYDQPKVINGISDLLVEVFGDKGKHARMAIGTNVLPFETPVEVEMIVKVK